MRGLRKISILDLRMEKVFKLRISFAWYSLLDAECNRPPTLLLRVFQLLFTRIDLPVCPAEKTKMIDMHIHFMCQYGCVRVGTS